MSLGDYVGPALAERWRFLNERFGPDEKILYLFRAMCAYARPKLYQPNVVGAATVVYASTDPDAILGKLRRLGIRYLCLDNDVASPIFEPQFFVRHFVPIKDPIDNFFLFEIDYDGINDEGRLEANAEAIAATGFFDLLRDSLARHGERAIEVPSNPYRIKSLMRAFEKWDQEMAPSTSRSKLSRC